MRTLPLTPCLAVSALAAALQVLMTPDGVHSSVVNLVVCLGLIALVGWRRSREARAVAVVLGWVGCAVWLLSAGSDPALHVCVAAAFALQVLPLSARAVRGHVGVLPAAASAA